MAVAKTNGCRDQQMRPNFQMKNLDELAHLLANPVLPKASRIRTSGAVGHLCSSARALEVHEGPHVGIKWWTTIKVTHPPDALALARRQLPVLNDARYTGPVARFLRRGRKEQRLFNEANGASRAKRPRMSVAVRQQARLINLISASVVRALAVRQRRCSIAMYRSRGQDSR